VLYCDVGDQREQVGDDQSRPCARGDNIVLDSLHGRQSMQLLKGGSYMVAWFQVEHESRRRVQDSLQWCQ